MARGRTARPKEQVEEVKSMDFEAGKRVYFEDVKPARSQASEHMQSVSTAMKHVKKRLGMVPGGYQVALKLYEMEAGKREAFIRTVVGQLNELMGLAVLSHHYTDLVDLAQQPKDDGYARPNLSVVSDAALSDGDETDFMEAANAIVSEIDAVADEGASEKPKRGRKTAPVIGEGFTQPLH